MSDALWISLGVILTVGEVVGLLAIAFWIEDRIYAWRQRRRRRRDNARSGVIRFPVPPVRERKWRR